MQTTTKKHTQTKQKCLLEGKRKKKLSSFCSLFMLLNVLAVNADN